ncbi:hypothetical protein D3C80_710120 [compost metagenome]
MVLHIVDHLFPPLLAEVDVEVGHGDPFGVQEALEQQAEPQRVQIGDGQRPGHQRTGAGTPPRSHRDAVQLGPLDEVGHDQEVAGEAHLLNDPHLPFQAGPVFLLGRGGRDLLQAGLQPLTRLVRQFVGFRAAGARVEARQDRRPRRHQEGATAGDVDGVVAGLGQVREQVAHGGCGLEPVLAGDAAAVFLTGKGAVGDAQQGVMRLRLRRLGVVDVVGGDQGHVVGVGPFDQPRLGHRFLRQAVTLQLHVETVAEDAFHFSERR